MQKLVRRLAMLLALLLALAGLSAGAMAEDWRDTLFGLLDTMTDEDYEAADAQAVPTEAPMEQTPQFELPVTDPQQIVNYLELYGELPENFITKKEAQELGWDSRYNYVGDVAPGKSIGGDRFGNYEGNLPSAKGRQWFECDANYNGKRRNAERVLFSSDGLYYYTDDHYNTFTEMYPEVFQ